MPQGKGTYGSQVGRPSKKKYNKGGSVDPFSTRNPEGVPAEQLAEAMENQNMTNEGLPTTNAQERSQASPDVTEYKEGGKVDVTDIVKKVERYEKADKQSQQLLTDPTLSADQKEGVAYRKKARKELKKQKVAKLKKKVLKRK